MTIKRPGIIVPPLTPFTPELKTDFNALRNQIDYIIEECSPVAISIAGVETQEYQYLSFEDRAELIKKTAEFTAGRCPTIVGISHPSYLTSRELAKLAEKVGATAVQVLAPLRPFGGNPSKKEVLDYFRAIASETSLPILIYHNPGPGSDLPIDLMVELAQIESVEYFKESSRDLRRIGILIEEIERSGLAHYFTTMEVLLPSLHLGGSGGTMPPPAAKVGFQLTKAFENGDLNTAIANQRKFYLFPGKWNHYGLAPLMKLAMNVLGNNVGLPYPPFQPISPIDEKEIIKTIRLVFSSQ